MKPPNEDGDIWIKKDATPYSINSSNDVLFPFETQVVRIHLIVGDS
jgi:hypothetical protein